MSASTGMTMYSAAPPILWVNAERRTSKPRVSPGVVDDGAAVSAGSPPPCEEGSGVGVGVSARAASPNDCSHSNSYQHGARERILRVAPGRVKQVPTPVRHKRPHAEEPRAARRLEAYGA